MTQEKIDQAAPELHRHDGDASILLYTLNQDGWRKGQPVMVNDVMIRIENANGSQNDLGAIAERIRTDLAAPSAHAEVLRTVYEPYPGAFDHILGPDTRNDEDGAPAEVEGLVAALIKADRGHDPGKLFTEAATALTALQAENERLKKNLFVWRDRAVEEEARAEKAEAERDAAEEREFNRGYLIACCNLTNLHDMPEVGFDVLRELGLSKAQVDGFGLSEYDTEALRNIEKSRSGSVYVDDARAKLKEDV